MGYRSDVGIALLFPNMQKTHEFCTTIMATQPQTVRECLAEYNVEQRSDCVVLHVYFEGVKWYKNMSFDDVDGHEELQVLARERGAGVVFVRIGEDNDDVEEYRFAPDKDGDWWDDNQSDTFQLVRSISPYCGHTLVDDKPLTAGMIPAMVLPEAVMRTGEQV